MSKSEKSDKNRKQGMTPKGPFCQSCSMPMESIDCFGTNADEGKNDDYCCHCFLNGEFTDQKITLEEMIDLSASILAEKENMPEPAAKEICKTFIPTLKRWQK